jgi:predicted nucleic-acid-binding Zn-ribbon protein
MFYNREELERLRKKGEEQAKELEEKSAGYKYKSQAGIQIFCHHCKYDHFHKGNALLNTRGLTFLDLDWLNESATTLVCHRCGFIHWFGKEVKQL